MFNLNINEDIVVSHDIAFSTTMIKKNGITIPLGKFIDLRKGNFNYYANIREVTVARLCIRYDIQLGTVAFAENRKPDAYEGKWM